MPLAPFIRTGSGFHPTIDRDALLEFYKDLPPRVWCINSPSDLVGWEILREHHGFSDPNAVPCDLFVWATGEPPDGRLTRVGGVPWLPKRIPWPVVNGVLLQFLCQFDFRDSRDLVRGTGGLIAEADEHEADEDGGGVGAATEGHDQRSVPVVEPDLGSGDPGSCSQASGAVRMALKAASSVRWCPLDQGEGCE